MTSLTTVYPSCLWLVGSTFVVKLPRAPEARDGCFSFGGRFTNLITFDPSVCHFQKTLSQSLPLPHAQAHTHTHTYIPIHALVLSFSHPDSQTHSHTRSSKDAWSLSLSLSLSLSISFFLAIEGLDTKKRRHKNFLRKKWMKVRLTMERNSSDKIRFDLTFSVVHFFTSVAWLFHT